MPNLLAEILDRYPIRNSAWDFLPESNLFAADYSDLEATGNQPSDPWNRPLERALSADLDHEREITGWRFQTTVENVAVPLLVIND